MTYLKELATGKYGIAAGLALVKWAAIAGMLGALIGACANIVALYV